MAYPWHYVRLLAVALAVVTFFTVSVPGADWPANTTLPYSEGLVLSLFAMVGGGGAIALLMHREALERIAALVALASGACACLGGYFLALGTQSASRTAFVLVLSLVCATAAGVLRRSEHAVVWELLFPAALFAVTYGFFGGYPVEGFVIGASLVITQLNWTGGASPIAPIASR